MKQSTLKLKKLNIGDILTRQELKEQGWTLVQKIMKCSAEIWSKNTWLGTYEQKIIWRIKTQTIYLMWDKRKEAKI